MKVFYSFFLCNISSWLPFDDNHSFDIIAPFIVHFWKKHYFWFLCVFFVSMESFVVFFKFNHINILGCFISKLFVFVLIQLPSLGLCWILFVYLVLWGCFLFFWHSIWFWTNYFGSSYVYCCLKFFRTTHSLDFLMI